MHCELLIPALFAMRRPQTDAAAQPRFPALELLLARGRRREHEPSSTERWLAQACGCGEGPVAAGALTLLGAGGTPGDALWARADPVHLRLAETRLALVPGAALGVTREEAESIAATLNRHYAGTLEFVAVHPERWCVRLGAEESGMLDAFDAAAPLDIAGRDLDGVLPRGTGEARVHARLNEIQMLLHEHPANLARAARGAPQINSLWLWGPGRAPRAAAAPWRTLSAQEPIARGLARLSGSAPLELPEGAAAWLADLPAEGRHLAVLDALRAPAASGDRAAFDARLRALEERWCAPLLAALRGGRIGMLSVHAPQSGASFETIRADLRRFWRRARPLLAYAER